LGSIPGLGTDWQLSSEVDAVTGQIGITLYSMSMTPITAMQAGSLVNIAFHVASGATVPATAVQLVNMVTPNGRRIVTGVDDDQGPMILSPGMDRLVIMTGVSSVTVSSTSSTSHVASQTSGQVEHLAPVALEEADEAGPFFLDSEASSMAAALSNGAAVGEG